MPIRTVAVPPFIVLSAFACTPRPSAGVDEHGASEGTIAATTSGTGAETSASPTDADGNATSGTGAGSDGSGDPATGSSGGIVPCELQESGPIVASADSEVIENLHIVARGGPGIVVQGHVGVVIRNVRIEHEGGPGIDIGGGSDDLRIEDVSIEHTGAPQAGENPSDALLNIGCYGSARLSVVRARLTRGSSGIYLVECPDAALSFLEGHDFRGPFPRGQLVQLDKSDGGVLEDFSVINPPGSWPEDNVNVYQSVDVEIRRGLIDGNNSPSGVGVIFDGDLALGVVEDVDAVRMGNGCFSDYAGSDGVIFRRTRCRENICGDQGRGPPLSNALMWSGSPNPAFTQIRIEDSHWFAACNPGNIVWPEESFAVIELEEEDFVLRDPISLQFCWEV